LGLITTLTQRGIPLTVAVGSNADEVSEQAMFLILSLIKQGFIYHKSVLSGQLDFRQRPVSSSLNGRSILIIGFGRAGSRLSVRATFFWDGGLCNQSIC
jgi:phosphoglycerate dehydrogenase-like enzyme